MKLHLNQIGDPQSPPIVFLHGFMGSGQSFLKLMERLAKHYRCIAVDLPGHGRSLFTEGAETGVPETIVDVAGLILQRLSEEGVERFALYGYSMGGRVAQAVCLESPARISRLILESASFGIRDEAERQQRYRKDRTLLDDIDSRELFRRFLEKWHRLPLFCTLHGSALLEALKAAKLANDVEQLRKALQVMSVGSQPWFLDRLSRSEVPITYFYGERDIKYRDSALAAARTAPGLNLKAFDRASHNIHLQFLPEVVAALEEILPQGFPERQAFSQ